MIFEIEEIPDGGLDFNLLAEKEQFEINHRIALSAVMLG